MKYIKTFESYSLWIDDRKTLYQNDSFSIIEGRAYGTNSYKLLYVDKLKSFKAGFTEVKCHAIFAMMFLIARKSKYIRSRKIIDTKLRKIKLIPEWSPNRTNRECDIEEIIRELTIDPHNPEGMIKLLDLEHSRNSYINNFFPDKEHKLDRRNGEPASVKSLESLSNDNYRLLVLKYYPKLIEAIKQSKTLGDIIDKFTIIYEEIKSDVEFYLTAIKYNL